VTGSFSKVVNSSEYLHFRIGGGKGFREGLLIAFSSLPRALGNTPKLEMIVLSRVRYGDVLNKHMVIVTSGFVVFGLVDASGKAFSVDSL